MMRTRSFAAVILAVSLLEVRPVSSFCGPVCGRPFAASAITSSSAFTVEPRSRIVAETLALSCGILEPGLVSDEPTRSSMSRGPNSRWALSAKYSYDTLEEAMEYARAKSGRAAVSDEVDGNNEGAEGANDTDGTAMASGKVTVKKTSAVEVSEEQPKADEPVAEAAQTKEIPGEAHVKKNRKSSGGAFEGWDWGFKSKSAKAKPVASKAGTGASRAGRSASKAATGGDGKADAQRSKAAKDEKKAEAAQVKAQEAKNAQDKAQREKEAEEAARTAEAKAKEEEVTRTKAAADEAKAARAQVAKEKAAKEKVAEQIAARARGDVPKSGAVESESKAAPKKRDNEGVAQDANTEVSKVQDGGKAVTDVKASKKQVETVEKATVAKDSSAGAKPGSEPEESSTSMTLSKPETIVVVTGATGRVGQLAVRRILELYPQVLVRAVVSDYGKGQRLLKEEKNNYGIKLEIMSAELSSMRSATKVVEGASAVVFCASGFAQNLSPLQRLANAVRLTLNPNSVTDVEGVRDVALALKAAKKINTKNKKAGMKDSKDVELQPLEPHAPRFVLLSSAAVTRPNWTSEEKALYPLAADVPIVKLNPLNILTVKAQGEKELREVGIPYAVVRPCGLNDDHPKGRPLFSVGDTASGRICREDVADVLVRCLSTKNATGKTFEVQSLPGLDKVAASVKAKSGIDLALSNLPTDEEVDRDPEMLAHIRRYSYPIVTQLRPVPLFQANLDREDVASSSP